LTLVLAGLVAGIAAALAATRVPSSYLFDTARPIPTFAVAGLAFLVAGVIACLGPAWRAVSVDPMLRCDQNELATPVTLDRRVDVILSAVLP
jgi:ABC-type antimicrobial peptide transport system permease subunit